MCPAGTESAMTFQPEICVSCKMELYTVLKSALNVAMIKPLPAGWLRMASAVALQATGGLYSEVCFCFALGRKVLDGGADGAGE